MRGRNWGRFAGPGGAPFSYKRAICVSQRARQRNVELPLILSDRADWDALTATIQERAPSNVRVTHGREEALSWSTTRQIKALHGRWRISRMSID